MRRASLSSMKVPAEAQRFDKCFMPSGEHGVMIETKGRVRMGAGDQFG